MKKFLSLVMALVMTMSLVTIGAGATEYKDLTDKDEIQYEEAVAVLNKLGIISGYEDGSFRPTGALTRGAAAKIIVSLMIGPEAANALTVNTAPYSDVPVTNTFAAVISYCKTAGYINGYTDGTFRPAGALTGYAFTKMLLGALGYDGVQERFSGEGWTMNVARLGNEAGLFNDFATAFSGNGGVDRESACLLALNTLKATQVEYTGGTNITTSTGDATTNVTTNKERKPKTSTNANINQNIVQGSASGGAGSNYYTLEFGEEHFQDLKLENARANSVILDSYGRPSNQWTLRNVEIGTYAKTADYTFTAGASGDTDNDKVRSMGLSSYDFVRGATSGNTTVYKNGQDVSTSIVNGDTNDGGVNAKFLADNVKNGTTVQVYLSDATANVIAQVAVIETQVVKINRVTADNVTFSRVEGSGVANALNAVNDEDELYNVLKDLKADDFVVVTPLHDTGTTYDVDAVFIPTTVTGNISTVRVNSSNLATALTVADTTYSMSQNWTVEDAGNPDGRVNQLNGSSVSTTTQSVVYLDSFGYAIYVENVNATTSNILFDETYTNSVNGRIHYFAQGWDMNGNEVSLDLGTNQVYAANLRPGTVYTYTSNTTHSNAEYEIGAAAASGTVEAGGWLANKSQIGSTYYADNVKYIFISWESNGTDVDTITVRDGAQEISANVSYQYVMDRNNSEIIAVVFGNDNDVEVSQNVMYIDRETHTTTDASGRLVSVVTAYIDGTRTTNVTLDRRVATNSNSIVDGFYTYSVNETTGVYNVNRYNTASGRATSVISGAFFDKGSLQNNAYLTNVYSTANVTGNPVSSITYSAANNLGLQLNLANATVIDLRTGGTLSSARDMANETNLNTYQVSFVYNDSSSSSSLGRVAYVFIRNAYTVSMASDGVTLYSVAAPAGTELSTDGTSWSGTINFTGAVGSSFFIRPSGSDFFFQTTPAENGAQLGGSAGIDAVGDGSYKVTLVGAVTADVADTAFTSVSVATAKLSRYYLDTAGNGGSGVLYLYFVDADGDQVDGSSFTNKDSIAVSALRADGYEAFVTSSGVRVTSGMNIYDIVSASVLGNVLVVKVNGTEKFINNAANDTVAVVTGVTSNANVYVQQVTAANVTTFVATDGAAGTLVDGANYITNGTAGYAKLDLTTAVDVTGSAILNSNVAFALEAGTGVIANGSDSYVPVGGDFTVGLKATGSRTSAQVSANITVDDDSSTGATVALKNPVANGILIASGTAIANDQVFNVVLSASTITGDVVVRLALVNA